MSARAIGLVAPVCVSVFPTTVSTSVLISPGETVSLVEGVIKAACGSAVSDCNVGVSMQAAVL